MRALAVTLASHYLGLVIGVLIVGVKGL